MSNKLKFILLWIGQLISILGSSIFHFALFLWVYEKTANATHLTLLTFSNLGPLIYLSIFAGYFVDKFKRKRILQICDLGLAITNVGMIFLIKADPLPIAFLVLISFISGILNCVQTLTFQTTVSMFIKRNDLLKYNGILSIIKSVPIVIGPILGGALINLVGISNIIFLDIGTFLIGFFILTFISFPDIKSNVPKKFEWNNITFGLKYIFSNKTLKQILFIFMFENFFSGLTVGLIIAFLIEKTSQNNLLVAYSSSFIALGGVLGGFIISKLSQSIKKPLNVIMIGFFIIGFVGRVLVGLTDSIFFIGLFLMVRNTAIPIVNASCESIWQKETPQEYQGRVFGARRFFAQSGIPIAILLSTWLLNFAIPIDSGIIHVFSKQFGQSLELTQLVMFFVICGVLEMITPTYFYLKK